MKIGNLNKSLALMHFLYTSSALSISLMIFAIIGTQGLFKYLLGLAALALTHPLLLSNSFVVVSC